MFTLREQMCKRLSGTSRVGIGKPFRRHIHYVV